MMVAIVSHKREAIQRAVREMYTAVAASPDQRFHFPTGRSACEAVGYPPDLLNSIPDSALESFAGVGFPFSADVIHKGDHVLDVGSGSGTDALIAAHLVGHEGKVFGLDMTSEMRKKLERTATEANISNLEIIDGEAESIPLPEASVDVVTTNGVLNLVPDKAKAISEIYRVLKPGGRLQISDIALTRPVAEKYRQDPQMWAECVVGAVEEERYLAMLRNAGFTDVALIHDFDYFALSSSDTTREVAGLFTAHAITLRANKSANASQTIPYTPTRRAIFSLFNELGGVFVAVLAWLTCAGFPSLVAAFGAIGAGSLTQHSYMITVYAAFLGISVWLLWHSGRARVRFGPFWLGLVGSLFALLTTWLSIVGFIAQGLVWWSYLGIACVVAASIWSYFLGRQPGACLAEMRYEARRLKHPPSLTRRLILGGLVSILAATLLYGIFFTIEESVWW